MTQADLSNPAGRVRRYGDDGRHNTQQAASIFDGIEDQASLTEIVHILHYGGHYIVWRLHPVPRNEGIRCHAAKTTSELR